MKTNDGMNVICIFSGKVCYTEREAGILINNCKKHYYVGHQHSAKAGSYSNSKDIPRRKYYCKDCGFFHVTHQPLYALDSHNYSWEAEFYKEYEAKRNRA